MKYPYVRSVLINLWREALQAHQNPLEAWKSIVENPDKAKSYKQARGKGGFVRAEWPEVLKLISASLLYTVITYGPDRNIGFSPIPAMSMISHASGSRFMSLIGGPMLSFYDWYADLPRHPRKSGATRQTSRKAVIGTTQAISSHGAPMCR